MISSSAEFYNFPSTEFPAYSQIFFLNLNGMRATGRESYTPLRQRFYLRTVIVTAAVHRGFSSKREPLTLTFRHRAGVSPYTSTFVLAQTYVFGKQLHGFLSCGPHEGGRPYSEVTAACLPSSLTKNHSYTLVFST